MSKVVTKFSGVIRSTKADSFAVEFLTTKENFIVGISTSDFVFGSVEAAHEGAKRAMDVLEKTGYFPNLSSPF